MNRKHLLGVFRSAFVGAIALATLYNARAVDLQTRCSDPNVLRCITFDTLATLTGTYGDISGTLPGAANPQIDTTIKASGTGSMKLTVTSCRCA